jgi:H/ACA ribonucleoprotein complex subunit 4
MKDIEELIQFGIVNVDKPAGPTAYRVSEFIKRQLGLKKTSHMGTLDPKVTGVLPITLGRSCRLADYFIKHDKDYTGILHTHSAQDIKKLQKIIDENFLGKIKQTPPHRSAVKRAERTREVYNFKFLEASKDGRDFLFECSVQGGTYIRKICSDLGEMIGGAHMGELRRARAGIFDESKLYNLEEFERSVELWKNGDGKVLREMIVPAGEAIKKVLKFIDVEKRVLKALHHGKPLFLKDVVGGSFKSPLNSAVPKTRPISSLRSPKVSETPGDGGGNEEIAEGEHFAAFCDGEFVGIYRRTGEEVIFGRAEFVKN